ncbi:MAG: RluA family pseudouridine synthase [Candidatus Omnitrophota bacterium]
MEIPVIFEDDWLLVVNKPASLLTIPGHKGEPQTLTSLLGLHPCHRLDKETSGLIIYAKGKSTQQKTMALFHGHKVKKTYIAFVQGKIERPQGEIKQRIEGQPALTRYRVIEQRSDFAVVEVQPFTGRTNQIRIHFKSIGHPLVGEKKFAFRKDFSLKANRLCLHAQILEFPHPITGKTISLKTELPAGMKNFLEKHVY